jgi:protein-S-isoprenylcysteine O-methyltransferase Ste14
LTDQSFPEAAGGRGDRKLVDPAQEPSNTLIKRSGQADNKNDHRWSRRGIAMARIAALLYGVISYLVFLVAFLYAIGFVGNIVVPKSIDTGPQASFTAALLIDVVLLGLFAIQHNVMARPWFKTWWTRIVSQAVERSTFVLFASFFLLFLYWQWRPISGVVWNIENAAGRTAVWGLFWVGWLTVLLSTFMINHFDLFGLRQVLMNVRGQAYKPLEFKTSGLYKLVRHPLMLGFIVAFWATPMMTVGHLLFAVVTTIWILISIQLEERDLMKFHGEVYRKYREGTSMLLPIPRKR